jgi:hypothetical protein
MAQRKDDKDDVEEVEPEDKSLQRCETAAGTPAWRYGKDGYPYGYDTPEQEETAKQQARDYGKSMDELKK